MTDREAMQQALDALELLSRVPKAKRDYADRAIVALKERLAQPEPVIDKSAAIRIATVLGWEPRREWVGLTAAEFRKVVDGLEDLEDCWVALEHALKEKNNG